MEYIDKKKINIKYIDKNKEEKCTYAYSKARNYLKYKLFYSLPTLDTLQERKLVQFREKYDKQKTYMCFKFTTISIKILNKKPNMEYVDKKIKKNKNNKKKRRGSAHIHIKQ